MSYVVVMGDDPAGRDLVATSLRDAGYPIVLAHLDEPPSALLADEGIELAVCRADSPGSPALSLLETVRRLRPGLPAVLVTHALTELDVSGSPPPELVSEPFAPEELARAAARALGRLVQEAPPGHADTTLVGLLANAIETRKPTSNGHSERLASIAVDLAEALGLRDAALATVRTGAMLHDVGYIGIPEQILLKLGALEPEEGSVMRTHTLVGDQLLAPLADLAAARPIVRSHHERWDGHGYPDGLAGESIPLAARIVAVADGIEAMSAHRSYRTTLTPREIVRELAHGRGTQWDPRVVDVAVELIRAGRIDIGGGGEREAPESETPAGENGPSVLLVDEQPERAAEAKHALELHLGAGCVSQAGSAAAAARLAVTSDWTLAVLDGETSSIELLHTLRAAAPELPILILLDEGSSTTAASACENGASDLLVRRPGYLGELADRANAILRGGRRTPAPI